MLICMKLHQKYCTKDDLNWMNKKSRSSIEMSDKSIRPEIADSNLDMESYNEIILGA